MKLEAVAFESLADRVTHWRSAIEDGDTENAAGLAVEIRATITGARDVPAPADPFTTALATVTLEGRTDEAIRADLTAAIYADDPLFAAADPTGPNGDLEFPNGILMRAEDRGIILPAGEVGMLAGAGGTGKSRLALQFAVAMAGGMDDGAIQPIPGTVDSGVRVCAGPAVLIGYEDARSWIAWRARQIATALDNATAPAESTGRHQLAVANPERLSVAVLDYGHPMFGVPAGVRSGSPEAIPQPLAAWRPVWDHVARIGARLVVIDPVALAVVWEGYSAIPVGLFVAAIRQELDALDHPCAALLIAHVSKAERKEPTKGAGAAVLGSVAWTDRARAVLTLVPDIGDTYRLTLDKANYARPGDLVRLTPISDARGRPLAFEAVSNEPPPKPKQAKTHAGATSTVATV